VVDTGAAYRRDLRILRLVPHIAERAVPHLLRPMISADRLTVRPDGRVAYHVRRPDPTGRTSWVTLRAPTRPYAPLHWLRQRPRAAPAAATGRAWRRSTAAPKPRIDRGKNHTVWTHPRKSHKLVVPIYDLIYDSNAAGILTDAER